MTRIVSWVLAITLPCLVAAQSQRARPSVESLNREVLVGDWTMAGTAKDSPTGPVYQLAWTLHGSRILGGAFVAVGQTWRGNGPATHALEIASYDTVTRIHSTKGFNDDGSTWVGTGRFRGDTLVEVGTTTEPGGKTSKWRGVYVYSADRMSLTGTEDAEENGVKWRAFTVKGTKAATPAKSP